MLAGSQEKQNIASELSSKTYILLLLCIARGVIIGVKGAMEILQKDRFIF